MSHSRPNVPGFHAVLLSLLPAGLVFWLQLLAITALADVPQAAVLFVEAAGWMLTSAVVLGFWGATRMRAQIGELQQRLAVALTDPVTGLPVRRVAEDAIVAAGPNTLLTVALADIDGLHDINHGPGGHATGDHYLTETGRRLRQAATRGDLVARLGGDEFVLITGRTPRQLASALTAAFADPVTGLARPAIVGKMAQKFIGCCRASHPIPNAEIEKASCCQDGTDLPVDRPGVGQQCREKVGIKRGHRPNVCLT